jgi:hypothetical protein
MSGYKEGLKEERKILEVWNGKKVAERKCARVFS